MANVKISALTDATSVALADELPIVQSGVTKRATVTELQARVQYEVVVDSTTARTLAATDNFKTILFTNSSAITITVPIAATGIRCQFVWLAGAGTITVTPSSTTVNGAGTAIVLSAAAGAAELIPTGTANTFYLTGAIGDLVPGDITAFVGSVAGFVETPTAKTYVLVQKARFPFTITEFTGDLSAGTLTAQLTIDGSNVTTGSLSATTTEASVTPSAANTVAVGQTLAVVISAPSSAADFAFDIGYTRTA